MDNWIVRFGKWLESRRVLRKPDLHNVLNRCNILEQSFKNYQIESERIPQTTAKELALIKIRLDQVELYTGLKREPKPEHVPGLAKIS